MAGGRNQPYQRENDTDEDAEMSDSEEEEIEELIEEFEYRLSREQRKRELRKLIALNIKIYWHYLSFNHYIYIEIIHY